MRARPRPACHGRRAARLGVLAVLFSLCAAMPAVAEEPARHRVLVSTDIGGSDPDDFQSMVHLLLYADSIDIDGLVSSPPGEGRKKHILEVIDVYAKDFGNLSSHSADYPEPDALRAVTKQGAVEVASWSGFGRPTEGSDWIIAVARRDDPRPLHVLVWGGMEDLAQALYNAPDILPKLRVYSIGGPNKKWSPNAYQYIVDEHPELWIIESNATYRGWFTGGDQAGDRGNRSFVDTHVEGHGALGDYFATLLEGTIKMGDTPSVGWILRGTPSDPTKPGWGGQFVRAWPRPHLLFERITTRRDEIEQFGIFELALPVDPAASAPPEARMLIENQALAAYAGRDGTLRFRFSPKEARPYSYRLQSHVTSIDGLSGELTAIRPPPDAADDPDETLPNWWTDDPDPAMAEGGHPGARTVSRWRADFLADFAERLDRSRTVADSPVGWSDSVLHRESSWYATGQAREIAGHVLEWQSSEGAWPKNIDLSQPATPAGIREAMDAGRMNTIDNDATVLPMRFLALVAQATGDRRYQAAFGLALDYLIAAQYSNGGWPQFYPHRPGYFARITFNDNAMINVMRLLRDVSDGDSEFGFVDPDRRSRAATAVARGIDCILDTQIRQDGILTAWAAQYDQVTLAPAWARAYEPPSLSGRESVDIVRLLMEIERPTPEQAEAIEAAIAWFRHTAISGLAYYRGAAGRATDGFVVADSDAAPLWARFYDLDSNRPIFTGRDSVIHYSLDELDRERRGGYAYYGRWAATLLSDEYPRWRERLSGSAGQPPAPVPVVWKLDNLETIGGHRVTVTGDPQLVDTPGGRALEFDGVDDGIFLDVHPLAGLREFTVEVTFRPDTDGSPEQRFFHMQEERSESRVMFETRLVENGRWFLDTFIKSGEQNVVLYAIDNEHAIGPWYHAAIVVDENSFSHFVNGRLELRESIDYEVQESGRTSIGVRLNEVHWFKGAIRTVRVSPRALAPGQFLSAGD